MSLADIKARAEKANAEMDRPTAGNPGTNWRWSIPANEDRDSDLILGASVSNNERLVAALEAVQQIHSKQSFAYTLKQPCACGDKYPYPTVRAIEEALR